MTTRFTAHFGGHGTHSAHLLTRLSLPPPSPPLSQHFITLTPSSCFTSSITLLFLHLHATQLHLTNTQALTQILIKSRRPEFLIYYFARTRTHTHCKEEEEEIRRGGEVVRREEGEAWCNYQYWEDSYSFSRGCSWWRVIKADHRCPPPSPSP